MRTTPIVTPRIQKSDSLVSVLRSAVPAIRERTIVAVTSKVVSVTTDRTAELAAGDMTAKRALGAQESEYYLESSQAVNGYAPQVTIAHGVLGQAAGIDASNSAVGEVLLLPKNPFKIATKLLDEIRTVYEVRDVGVLITDSITRPLRWGVVGTYLGYAGFRGVLDQRGELDLDGRALAMTTVNVAEAFAAAAVMEMGEAAQSQPFCIIDQLPEHISFVPSIADDDLGLDQVGFETDIYSPLLLSADWKKGGQCK